MFVVFPILPCPPKEKIAFSEILLGFPVQASDQTVPARESCINYGDSDQPAAALHCPEFVIDHVLSGFRAAALPVSLWPVSIW